MSHFPPAGCGVATPRWSLTSVLPRMLVQDPASMAGLPASSASVRVGPPLFWSGPSLGSVLIRSPELFQPQVLAFSRLKPEDENEPAQLAEAMLAVLSAMIVF